MRQFWFVILATALGLEAAALGFQYLMQLDPCVLCVYERVAVSGIALAGLLGMIAPNRWFLRVTGYLTWAISAVWGLTLAMKHVGIQLGAADFSCDFFANFPAWFQLDQWFPAVFLPTGYCDEIQWQFLGLSMPQWMLVVYSGYLLLLLAVLIGDLSGNASRRGED